VVSVEDLFNTAKLIAAFALSLPLFRYVAFHIGFSIADTLAAEAAAYSMGYAAIALLSGFSPWLGFAAYAANAVLGVHYPAHIYELTAAANFLAIGYLAVVWRRQSSE